MQSGPSKAPQRITILFSGGLAFPDDSEVQRVAARCIRLFDGRPADEGTLHVQAQRFLNPEWKGLCGNGCFGGNGDVPDPPLRHLMESLAMGESTLTDFFQDLEKQPPPDDAVAKHSFLYWVSAFRLAL